MLRPNNYVGLMPGICKEQLFHTYMYILIVLQKRFEHFGLDDILLEAKTVTQRSLPGVMKDRHYKRVVRVLKIMVEALSRKLINFHGHIECRRKR